MSLGVLIIGLGQIGMGYDLQLDPAAHIYSHVRAFSQHPNFHLVAGVDPDPDRRSIFERTYKCPAYEHVDAAVKRHTPDIVVLAVPTRFHGETLRHVLQRLQPKAVLCEKPLSYDVKEAEAMVEMCVFKGVNLYVNYMRRSDPGVIEIKKRLDTGDIHTPLKGVCWYSKGFFHNGSHFFNLLEYWLGRVQSAVMLNHGRTGDNADPEPDVRVAFEHGTIVFLAAWEEAFSHYTIELLAPNGRLRYEQGGERIYWQAVVQDPHFPGYSVLSAQPEVLASGMDRYQQHVVEELAVALDNRNSHLCTGAEALTTLKTMQGIIEK